MNTIKNFIATILIRKLSHLLDVDPVAGPTTMIFMGNNEVRIYQPDDQAIDYQF